MTQNRKKKSQKAVALPMFRVQAQGPYILFGVLNQRPRPSAGPSRRLHPLDQRIWLLS